MPKVPGPSEKDPAEGSRDTIERELKRSAPTSSTSKAKLASPGDEAVPGTPGTGETVCPVCGGLGRQDGRSCENCSGSGKVIKAIGGA